DRPDFLPLEPEAANLQLPLHAAPQRQPKTPLLTHQVTGTIPETSPGTRSWPSYERRLRRLRIAPLSVAGLISAEKQLSRRSVFLDHGAIINDHVPQSWQRQPDGYHSMLRRSVPIVLVISCTDRALCRAVEIEDA